MSTWVNVKTLSKDLGLTRRTVERQAKKGLIMRKRHPLTGKWVYKEPEDLGEIVVNKRYTYIKGKDLYIFSHDKHQFNLPGVTVRDIRRAYTSDKNYSVRQIAIDFAITEDQVVCIRTSLEFTRSSSPVTVEELGNASVEELADSILEFREKQKKVERSLEKKYIKSLEKRAKMHDHFHSVVVDALSKVDWGTRVELPEPRLKVELPLDYVTRKPYAAVVGLSDLHVGKLPHGGSHTLNGQIEAYEKATGALVMRLLKQRGLPEEFHLMIGSDLMHVDNVNMATRAGTPQGSQSIGSFHQHLIAAIALMGNIIAKLGEIAKVKVYWIPGNHDTTSSLAVAVALKCLFKDTKRVTVDVNDTVRKCFVYDTVPVYLDHGDKTKPETYIAHLSQMLMNSSEKYDLSKAISFSGHFHRAAIKTLNDQMGVDQVIMPSPVPSDAWHDSMGYTMGKKRIAMYAITEENGLEDTMFQLVNWVD